MGPKGGAYVDGVVALKIILPVSAMTEIFVSVRDMSITLLWEGHIVYGIGHGLGCGMKFLLQYICCRTRFVDS